MDPDHQLLSFMDLLDLDEEIVDSRLKNIMIKNTFTNEHLNNALHLLKYKNLINLQEETECGNEEEFIFIAKLLKSVNEGNIENVCKTVHIVLGLNTSTLISKSEHLLQQIISIIDLPFQERKYADGGAEEENSIRILLNFKLCDSILDVVINNDKKLSLPFLETPLENVLSSQNDKLIVYFLNNTVPKLFKGVTGYNILDRIWNFLKCAENKDKALKILSCLSDFYLPVPDNEGTMKFKSLVIFQYEFWNILLYGLMSTEPSARKISLYLIKRAIDCVTSIKRDVIVNTETSTIFSWFMKDMKILKGNWNNFFILIDSLEEKQSNIVLPSLQLFETIHYIPTCWLNCAFNIGLKHDNSQVRLKCVEYKLKTSLECITDTVVLLEALNDINVYESEKDCDYIKNRMSETITDRNNLVLIIKAMCNIKWSPVPLHHITHILSQQTIDLSTNLSATNFSKIIIDIIKLPCNNKIIRHAVKINLTHFIAHCYKGLEWENMMKIFSLLKFYKVPNEIKDKNPFIDNIKKMILPFNEKQDFFKYIATSHANVDFGLLYLENHKEDLNIFMKFVNDKVEMIKDVTKRQYSAKVECFSDVLFILHLFSKIQTNKLFKENIENILYKEYKTICCYIYGLLQSDDINLSVDEIALLFEGFHSMHIIGDDGSAKECLSNIYQPLTLLLPDKNIELRQKLFAVCFIAEITDVMYKHNKHNILNFEQLLRLLNNTTLREMSNMNDIGRFKTAFAEKCCEMIYKYISSDNTTVPKENLKVLFDYVENVIECGGYGCLIWILKIMNMIILEILKNADIKFNMSEFIDRMWKEIEELKSNNQYTACIEKFVELITQDELLNEAIYNNVVLLHCSKIIEYGFLKNEPLYFLVRELSKKTINYKYAHLMYVLSDILLFSPVPKKDQRIAENLEVEISKAPKYVYNSKEVYSHNYTIQYTAVSIISKITCPEILEEIACLVINKFEDHFRNKLRYHGNSQSHRLLLVGLQHLLYLNALSFKLLETDKLFNWAVEFLGRLPHQPSVRVSLEWYIANNLCFKLSNLDENVIEMMKSKNVPIISQFMIIYWTLKHKMMLRLQKPEEYEFVMDFFLSHTMGQIFNVRLLAQYLARELFIEASENKMKYVYIIEVIDKTFAESSKDKNFARLQEDYFIKSFDPVKHLTPSFIYYFLPRYFDVGNNEQVDKTYIKHVMKVLFTYNVKKQDFYDDHNWIDDEVFAFDFSKSLKCSSNNTENEGSTGTIQKKYIPWKNMGGIDVYRMGKKTESSSELIVVASLIDKLPNLGGMARTSEVFGVKTYVVNSLRHLQDKQFQGLSVSAERWVNIKEVRPGQPLKDYLLRKKDKGYCIVAAEQTSSSVQLQEFIFPKKTLLLLGHEKEGVPCDLLPIMDHCVEIPQQGFVRSLNVHVTAAIFVWEYSRQNIL